MFEPGTQVAYIPEHALGDIKHEDVEFGFVTSQSAEFVFCRFWKNGTNGILRTTANSEPVSPNLLRVYKSRRQAQVDQTLVRVIKEGLYG